MCYLPLSTGRVGLKTVSRLKGEVSFSDQARLSGEAMSPSIEDHGNGGGPNGNDMCRLLTRLGVRGEARSVD